MYNTIDTLCSLHKANETPHDALERHLQRMVEDGYTHKQVQVCIFPDFTMFRSTREPETREPLSGGKGYLIIGDVKC